MNYFNDISFADIQKNEKKKKKRKKQNFYSTYNYDDDHIEQDDDNLQDEDEHNDEHEYIYSNKNKSFKNLNNEEYMMKPVKFVSAGFLNDKKNINNNEYENNGINNFNDYSSDNDSDDYDEYDVFKHFVFDFNFHIKKKDEDFIKHNLKKYNLTELKDKDKNFEQYGLGFKILRKMGYEDGIGKNMKTNIAPIELNKKDIKVIEEKDNKSTKNKIYNNIYDSDPYDNIHNNIPSDESQDFNFHDDIHRNNLWMKKYSSRKYWNFKKIKNEIIADLKFNQSTYIDHSLNCQNEHFNESKNISNLQILKYNLNIHVQNITLNYFTNMKKQKQSENKIKNYRNYVNKNDLYKIQLSILKNILTYKYLLNIHTILFYPKLFNQMTYNQYIFSLTNFKHNNENKDISTINNILNINIMSNLIDDTYQKEYNMIENKNMIQNNNMNKKLIKLTNTSIPYHTNDSFLFKLQCEKNDITQQHVEYNIDQNNFEQNLNDLIIQKYNCLYEHGFFPIKNNNSNPKEQTNNSLSHNNDYTYKVLDNINEINNLIQIDNIQIYKNNSKLSLSDLYTFLFFIYENSNFMCLNTYVSNFFIEFLRLYFYNTIQQNETNEQEIKLENKNDDDIIENINVNQTDQDNSIKEQIYLNTTNDNTSLSINNKDEPYTSHNNNNNNNNNNKNNKNYYNYNYNYPYNINQNDIKYLIHLKKIILMGIEQNKKSQYEELEYEFDNIIYYNFIYSCRHIKNCTDLFSHLNLFKDILNKKYYKKILIHFIQNKIILTNSMDTQTFELNDHLIQDIQNKIQILYDINKQYDINDFIYKYYINYIFLYLQKCSISDYYIQLIQISLMNNQIYKKQILHIIVKKIIHELTNINFLDDQYIINIKSILLLYNSIDLNIFNFLFKVYFLYPFTKYVCNYLRQIKHFSEQNDQPISDTSKGDINQTKDIHTQSNNNNNNNINNNDYYNEEHKLENNKEPNIDKTNTIMLKKKYIYEMFKNVKSIFENNIMKDDSIKNIMFSILNVIKSYLVQDEIITFPVEKVLDFDKNKISSDDQINYYFLYKDIKIPLPSYAIPQTNNIYQINYKNKLQQSNTNKEKYTDYKFSSKKYLHVMNKLDEHRNEFKKKYQNEQDEDINAKLYLEKYCLQNDILFIQKYDRKINGHPVYSINKISIYINNNIIYIYDEQEWKPILLVDLINRISK
ncbi:conserved Plasmodium protein, unknown function [Plasmodium gaboni]|uniref:G-patch domain-containing protein n=1 Tax=Plasmodium gaboni TaxID=647221 RepID=A0ABY1UJD9_9APIC|nr:conserved Plasmodium protein, unknown function [Plasmodium gaboni]